VVVTDSRSGRRFGLEALGSPGRLDLSLGLKVKCSEGPKVQSVVTPVLERWQGDRGDCLPFLRELHTEPSAARTKVRCGLSQAAQGTARPPRRGCLEVACPSRRWSPRPPNASRSRTHLAGGGVEPAWPTRRQRRFQPATPSRRRREQRSGQRGRGRMGETMSWCVVPGYAETIRPDPAVALCR
jgi:hypothetical protein